MTVDAWALSIFVAFAITLTLWALLKSNSAKVEREKKFGCILLHDCTRTQFCKKDGRKRCMMRVWRKMPRAALVLWFMLLPWFIVLALVSMRLSALGQVVRDWKKGFPTEREMNEPLKPGVQL